MRTQVYKIHSDFYYVKDLNKVEYTCKLKEKLKKQKTDIFVGDFVEVDESSMTITSLIERKNYIPRPKASNIDLALVVCSLKNPDLDFIQLNRYLIFLKYHNINTAICFNKEDLIEDISAIKKEITDIYESLGYNLFFISAKNKLDLDNLLEFIKNKTIALCGMSGVGKSTLLNSIIPIANHKTNDISTKSQKGQHTTRHCEIIEYNDFKIMDTPGFSCLKFDFLLPSELTTLFDDINKYTDLCKYSNCHHDTNENGICGVVDNLDKINNKRYESYLCFLKESLEYKKKISKQSIKKEHSKKEVGNKTITKISRRKRENSRNTYNQKIKDYEDV